MQASNNYYLAEVIAPGIVKLNTPRHGQQVWNKRTVRKHKYCEISKIDLYKKEAYGPLGNEGNRADRIDAAIIDAQIKQIENE